jgi:beta-galactosidase
MDIAPIAMQKAHNLFQYQLPVVKTPQPQPMEYLGQNQGLILYRTRLIGHKSGKLKIWEPHDYALVFLNGRFIDTVYRDGGRWEVDLPKSDVKDPVLEILVEGMGHINFAQFMIDRKGITDRVTLNGMTLMNWETTLLPLDEPFMQAGHTIQPRSLPDSMPCNFFTGSFTLTETADTYLDLSQYVKGVVFVNGHNLGRFWHIGPQQRLYCPASWLKKGSNEIVVFDLHATRAAPISGHRKME